MSFPFFGEIFTFAQPDGSQLQVRGWGDQHYAVFETLDGYTVVKDPSSGFFHYATLSNDGEELRPSGMRAGLVDPQRLGMSRGLEVAHAAAEAHASESNGLPRTMTRWQTRRQEARNATRLAMASRGILRAPPQRETTGVYVGLCLLIQFPDVPGTISREEVEAFCNQPGYSGFGNNGSVFDYFVDNSGGKLQYTNIVAPYYTARQPRAYYTNPNITYGSRAQALVKEALAHHKAQGFNFAPLTSDNEDYVYALNIFYAGNVVNNWGEGLWPHAHHLLLPTTVAPGKRIYDYQITAIGNELTLGTYCHENGHMVCDFPDLYDYGRESRGIGVYCLMCAGSNVNPKNPTQISGYLKYKAGWASQITPITTNMNATIQAGENDFFLLRKNMAEYFLIENRQKSGRDQALPSSGLAIWHVDELGNNEHEQMTPTRHYECSLVQADNRFDLERGSNGGDNRDLFHAGINSRFADTTLPPSKWWDGTPAALDINNISQSSVSMTFSASVGTGTETGDGTGTPSPKAQWTFMVYLAGDNNLEEFGVTDLREMKAAGSTNDMHIVAQFDSMADQVTRRYHLTSDAALEDDVVQSLPEVNTGDPNMLFDFVQWAVTAYPAEHYALVLWNHGSGWKDDDIYAMARARGVDDRITRGQVRTILRTKVRRALFRTTVERIVEETTRRAILFDDTSADFLDSVEMRKVLDRITTMIGSPLDLLGFDACLMSMLEVLYQVRNGCVVAVGSQELEPGDGWPYHTILEALAHTPTMTPETLAQNVVESYIDFYRTGNPPPSVTQSAVRMDGLDRVSAEVSRLGEHFIQNLDDHDVFGRVSSALRYAQAFYDSDYLDLVDFCRMLAKDDPQGATGDAARSVLATLEAGETPILAARNSGGEVANANGLSIYLPARLLSSLYPTLDFAMDWQWDEFLSAFHQPAARSRERMAGD